jgi:hypothetical protein
MQCQNAFVRNVGKSEKYQLLYKLLKLFEKFKKVLTFISN